MGDENSPTNKSEGSGKDDNDSNKSPPVPKAEMTERLQLQEGGADPKSQAEREADMMEKLQLDEGSDDPKPPTEGDAIDKESQLNTPHSVIDSKEPPVVSDF